jgi:hypothetical protein
MSSDEVYVLFLRDLVPGVQNVVSLIFFDGVERLLLVAEARKVATLSYVHCFFLTVTPFSVFQRYLPIAALRHFAHVELL